MEIVAHGLWAGAAAVVAKRSGVKIRPVLAGLWATFPDVLAFGPMVAGGLFLKLTGAAETARAGHGGLPHFHVGLPLYQVGHSLITFAVIFGLATLVMRRPPLAMLGWLSHILIDIPTHSYSYYATRFLWPISDYSIDGIAWWTPWLWVCTYAGLALVYFLLWRKGWLAFKRRPAAGH